MAHVDDGDVGFYTSDQSLAARESLAGDQYGGWSGTAAQEELSRVQERVKVLRKASAR